MALRFRDSGKVQQTFLGLKVELVSEHSAEIRHPSFAHPTMLLEFPYQDAAPQGWVRSGPYVQKFFRSNAAGLGTVEESGNSDEETAPWTCDWDTWIHQWGQALSCTPPRLVRPGQT